MGYKIRLISFSSYCVRVPRL